MDDGGGAGIKPSHRSMFKALFTSHLPSLVQIKTHGQTQPQWGKEIYTAHFHGRRYKDPWLKIGYVSLQQRRREELEIINQATTFPVCSNCPHPMSPSFPLSSCVFHPLMKERAPLILFSSHAASQSGFLHVLPRPLWFLPNDPCSVPLPEFFPM